MIESASPAPGPVHPPRSRLDTVRHQLDADALAVVALGPDGLRVVSASGARIRGSDAVVVGAACARTEGLPPGTTAHGDTPTTTVHVVVLPPEDEGPGTVAAVVVLPRTAPARSGDEVTATLLEALTAPTAPALAAPPGA